MRRKLEREGCAFQEIKDEVRRAVAIEQLRRTQASVTTIAEQIGFQEPSAFHRAFKKWTGKARGVIGHGSRARRRCRRWMGTTGDRLG